MKISLATSQPSKREPEVRTSHAAGRSRAARESAELAMTPAPMLTLALELSDLCEGLAVAGQHALQERAWHAPPSSVKSYFALRTHTELELERPNCKHYSRLFRATS